MTREEAKDTLRRCVRQGTIRYSNHCRERMRQRGVTTIDLQHLLVWGEITALGWNETRRNWVCTVRGLDIEGDDLTAIVGITPGGVILVTAC